MCVCVSLEEERKREKTDLLTSLNNNIRSPARLCTESSCHRGPPVSGDDEEEKAVEKRHAVLQYVKKKKWGKRVE